MTTTPVIRRMMGDGRLDWRQTRANSRTFVVSEEQVVKMMKALAPQAPKPRVEKSKPWAPSPPRPRDTIFNTMHLRLTLPHPDDETEPSKREETGRKDKLL